MPTGYTAVLFDKPDTTLRQFILLCSRAFGACIEMRDDPMDLPPPTEVKPSTYHLDELRKAETEARALEVMPLAEAAARAQAEHASAIADNARYRADYEKETAILASMLSQIEAWPAPSPDHKGLRDFMIDQIAISKPYSYQRPTDLLTPEAWLDRAKKSAADDVRRHAEHWKEDQDTAARKTAWLRALWASLPTGGPARDE